MAFGDIAKLLASLDLDTRSFERGAGRVSGDLSKMEGGMGRISTRATALGTAVGVGIERLAEKGINVLFDSLRSGEEGLRTLQNAQAQTAAVIESTGSKAGVTAQQVRDLAESTESLTTVDDKVVQSGENMLLTFTNIGADVFPQATKAMVDMAVAMNGGSTEGIDLKNTAIQIGKALQDPIKGATALRRVGVALTGQQQDQIKKLLSLTKEEQEHYLKLRQSSKAEAERYKQQQIGSRISQAQKIILGELNTEFGKAGEAAGKSGAAGLIRLHDAVEDAQIALAEGLAPALEDIRGEIAKGLSDPGTQQDLRNLGRFLGDAAKSGLEFAKSIPWEQVGEGLKTAAGFAGKLIDAFAHLPPGVQATIVGLVGLNKLAGGGVIKIGVDLFKEGAQGIFKGLFQRGSSPANPLFVTGTGLGGGGVAGAASGGLGAAGKLFLVGEAIGLIAAVNEVRDNISSGLKDQATDIHGAVTEQINAAKPDAAALAQSLAGVQQGIDAITSNPLNVLVGGDALTELQRMRDELGSKLKSLDDQTKADVRQSERDDKANADKNKTGHDKTKTAVDTLQQRTSERLDRTKQATDAVRDRLEAARIALASATQNSATRVSGATDTAADRIITAIWGAAKVAQPVTVKVTLLGNSTAQSGGFLTGPGHHD